MSLHKDTTIVQNDGDILHYNDLRVVTKYMQENSPTLLPDNIENKTIGVEVDEYKTSCLHITLNNRYNVLCSLNQRFYINNDTLINGFDLQINDALHFAKLSDVQLHKNVDTPLETYNNNVSVISALGIRRYRKGDDMRYRDVKRFTSIMKQSVKSNIYTINKIVLPNKKLPTQYFVTSINIVEIQDAPFYNLYTEHKKMFILLETFNKSGILVETY